MPRELSARKNIEVVSLFFKGLSYDEIAQRTGVSKGAVVNIVGELRSGHFPAVARSEEVDVLREAAVALRKLSLDPFRAVVGLEFYHRLTELGVDPKDLGTYISMCHELSPDEVPTEGFVQAALRLHRLKEESGHDYRDIAAEAEQLARTIAKLRKETPRLQAELRRVDEATTTRREELVALQRQKEQRQQAVVALSKELEAKEESVAVTDRALKVLHSQMEAGQAELATVNAELASLRRTIRVRRQELKKLEAVGIDEEELRQISAAVQTAATTSRTAGSEVVDRLLQGVKYVEGGLRLEAEIERLKERADGLTNEAEQAELRRRELLGDIAALRGEKAELENHIESIRGRAADDLNATSTAAARGIIEEWASVKRVAESVVELMRQLEERVQAIPEELRALEEDASRFEWIGNYQRFLENPLDLSLEESGPLVISSLRSLRIWGDRHLSPALASIISLVEGDIAVTLERHVR